MKLLSLSPLPDADGFVRYTISQPDDGLQGIGKLDYVMNARNNFVFRAFESDADQPFHSPPDNIHAARYGGIKESRNATLGHTFILNSNTVAHTQFTVAHQLANIATDFPLTTAGLLYHERNGSHPGIPFCVIGRKGHRHRQPISCVWIHRPTGSCAATFRRSSFTCALKYW